MSHRTHKFLMAVLVLLLNAGILTWASGRSEVQNSHSTRKDFTGKSDVEEFTIHAGKSGSLLKLAFHARLTEGRLRVRVFDPSGKSSDSFELMNDRGERAAHGRFEPRLQHAVGVWKLRVERIDATGEYEFDWVAQ